MDISQDVQHPIAIACGLIELHSDTPKPVGTSQGIPRLHTRLDHVPGLDAVYRIPNIHFGKKETRMRAGDESGAPLVDLTHQGTGTEVPIL